MTEAKCLALARLRLDDRNAPYLWDDLVLQDALRTALQEALERSRMLHVSLPLTTIVGQATYALDGSTLDVLRVIPGGGLASPLRATTALALDDRRPGWADESGTPAWFIPGEASITLVPKPDAAIPLTVDVTRGLTEDDDLSILPERYHRDLVWWIAFECFAMKDADGEDSPRAQQALTFFERRFGPRKSAVWDRVARGLPPGATAVRPRLA